LEVLHEKSGIDQGTGNNRQVRKKEISVRATTLLYFKKAAALKLKSSIYILGDDFIISSHCKLLVSIQAALRSHAAVPKFDESTTYSNSKLQQP
jgi:hypothetical protein